MRRLLLVTFGILAISIQPSLAEKRVALVIGNSAYKNVPTLANPKNDAALVAETFKNAGFESVDFRPNVTKDDMRKALRDFADQARDSDIAIVYYAGHGIEVDGVNFVIPVDAVLERDTDVYDETYPLDRLLVAMEPAKKLRLIILDACRDNPFAKTMQRSIGTRSIGNRGLAQVEPNNPNTLIAFAAKAGSTASDGGGKDSPFATALVSYIAKPGLDLRRAFGFVRDDVMKVTNNAQEPFVYGSLGGDDVWLVPPPASASVAAPVGLVATDASENIRQDYELAQQVGTKDAWNTFISRYPSGFYSDLARAQSKKLEGFGAQTNPGNGASFNNPVGFASLAPPDNQNRASQTPSFAIDPTRQVLVELQRVGCNTGAVDGPWNAAAQRSMALFNRYAGTRFDVKIVSLDALEVIKGRLTRVCPIICDHGYRADGENCVKIACRPGYEVGDDNTCEAIVVRKPVQRQVPQVSQEQYAPAPRPRAAYAAPSGEVYCPGGVCRPVSRGCHIVNDYSNGSIMNGGVQVCN